MWNGWLILPILSSWFLFFPTSRVILHEIRFPWCKQKVSPFYRWPQSSFVYISSLLLSQLAYIFLTKLFSFFHLIFKNILRGGVNTSFLSIQNRKPWILSLSCLKKFCLNNLKSFSYPSKSRFNICLSTLFKSSFP